MDRYNLNVFKDGYFNWKSIGHNIKNFFSSISRAWQRATKGYCKWDLYDLDKFYLALMINSLKEFRTNLHGFPIDKSFEEWQDIIDEIINHLEQYEADHMKQDQLHAALTLLEIYWSNLWD